MMYVATSEYDGACVGTLEEILEWVKDNGVCMSSCEFYEIGNQVKVALKAEKL